MTPEVRHTLGLRMSMSRSTISRLFLARHAEREIDRRQGLAVIRSGAGDGDRDPLLRAGPMQQAGAQHAICGYRGAILHRRAAEQQAPLAARSRST